MKKAVVVLLVLGLLAGAGYYISKTEDTASDETIQAAAEASPSEIPSSLTETHVETTNTTTTSTTTTKAATTSTTTTEAPTTSTTTKTTTTSTTTTQAPITFTATTEKEITAKPATPVGRTVYITATGSKYHYANPCGRGTYYASTLDNALALGLEPCAKCVLR
jgi:Na+-transporting methylmalonyl-CoA/oxaloacetate decarboxylase gamma subunit